MTVEEVFEREERRCLIPWRGPFDGYQSRPGSVSKTCLVRFDANGYSVEARAAQRVVDIFAYADRVDFYLEGKKVGSHPRCFERGRTVYEPLHYLRVLERKPGAFRNGAPLRNWTLPASIAEVRARLSGFADGDRQMVGIHAKTGKPWKKIKTWFGYRVDTIADTQSENPGGGQRDPGFGVGSQGTGAAFGTALRGDPGPGGALQGVQRRPQPRQRPAESHALGPAPDPPADRQPGAVERRKEASGLRPGQTDFASALPGPQRLQFTIPREGR